jgi:outer membrane protein assembly factor BamA
VQSLYCRRLTLVCLTLLAGACSLYAQEPPPFEDDPPAAEQRRIVEDRPALYTFKRGAHPVTWVGAVVKPLFKLSQSDLLKRFTKPKPRKHVKFGVTGMGSGSGFGPEVTPYHRDFLGRGIEVEVPLLYTYKHYESYGVNVRVPIASQSFAERLTFDVGTAYQSRASDKFFGMGNDSVLEDKTSFRTVTRGASAGLSAEMNDEWTAGLHLSYRNVGVTDPRGSGSSTQEDFAAAGVPGLFSGAVLLSTAFTLERDTRPKDELFSSGGVQRVVVSLNESISKGDFSYWKYRFEFLRQFPLTSDKRKVIALRGTAETNHEKGGSGVPFFDMPTLGNWRTLRGYDNYRFYDKSAVSAGIEYRYRIWRPIDAAIFVDVGQVAPEVGDFGLNRFHTGYGVRIITMPKPNSPISFDIARSSEKWRWYVNFGKTF